MLHRESRALSQGQGSANSHNETRPGRGPAAVCPHCAPALTRGPPGRQARARGSWPEGREFRSGNWLTIARLSLGPPPQPFVPPTLSTATPALPGQGPRPTSPGAAEPIDSPKPRTRALQKGGEGLEIGQWRSDVRPPACTLSLPPTLPPAHASSGSHTASDRAAWGGGCQPRCTRIPTQRESEGTKLGQKKSRFPKRSQKCVSPCLSPPDSWSPRSTVGLTRAV